MTQLEDHSSHSLKQKFLFLRRWLENPLQLGAILPSSKALSVMIARHIVSENQDALDQGGFILELGAGTGAFTQALLNAGVPPNRLISVEIDPLLYNHLVDQFPDVLIIRGDARALKSIIPDLFQKRISVVLSGIPMMTIPSTIRKEIIESVFEVIDPGGPLYQFTYSPFSSISTDIYNLTKRRIGTVFWNLPPATVWCYAQNLDPLSGHRPR
jgi:phosphatidylethanolamine/phosphatidyl-N-methylethanolamine N-methyltransferase